MTINVRGKTEIQITSSNEWVEDVNIVWVWDHNSISVCAVFWCNYMKIRDGYIITTHYSKLGSRTVNVGKSTKLKIVTMVEN